ncbi:MAG: tyrosine-type recombinase/integrase [Kiritimatiellae bacterium]|jgi:site-specific recombinase XerD|nr:tyrosine-type recombinase/integrase [Kiritimatiellia bacterium]
MRAWTLCSCLAEEIGKFIKLRCLSGTDYASQARLLGYFDHFLVGQNIWQRRITRETCDSYQKELVGLAPRSQGNRFCVVRQLCRYLALSDPLSYIPEALRTPSSHQTHRAYIFTKEEVAALLRASLQLTPTGSLRPQTYWTLFGLLYSTGLRIGEAMALNIEDFFPAEMRLYVAKGKFRKARWIVLSESTRDALQQYLEQRGKKKPNIPESPLLLNECCRQLSHPTVYATYRTVLKTCDIAYHKDTGPRIHDLRHTFAVHRLLAWYQDGEDINARLPALATYMGHVDISSTLIYLQPTAELQGEVSRRFHNHYLNHIASEGEQS